MIRTDILNFLAKKHNYTSYLEIGVEDGKNFRKIDIANKTGVDPNGGKDVLAMTSDEFFRVNRMKFDLIFIDGLHHASQVAKDIENALKILNANGTILCHDMNPTNEKQQITPRSQEEWTGDCWKAWVYIKQCRSELSMFVIDTDFGCGIIRFGSQPLLEPDLNVTWSQFDKNRKAWLGLISEGDFLTSMCPPQKTVCLTLTGDRPALLDLSRKWFERSDKIGTVDWLVIDDGVTPHNPGGCQYVRREPDGPNSLIRQLKFALPLCASYDNILIWEDDDWYALDRAKDQICNLMWNPKPLHGYGRAIYYHLTAKGFVQHCNTDRASLCAMAFRSEFIPNILACADSNDPFIDLRIWKMFGKSHGTISLDNKKTVGIKGGPGRGGCGNGHDHRRMPYNPKNLALIIGDDAKYYDGLK